MRNEERKAHLVGSGIANLAAAAYLIKDGGFDGANINIYEEESLPGGSLVSAGSAEKGYFRRGERIFEENYVCMYDLLSFIPSLDDPTKTVKQDTHRIRRAVPSRERPDGAVTTSRNTARVMPAHNRMGEMHDPRSVHQ